MAEHLTPFGTPNFWFGDRVYHQASETIGEITGLDYQIESAQIAGGTVRQKGWYYRVRKLSNGMKFVYPEDAIKRIG